MGLQAYSRTASIASIEIYENDVLLGSLTPPEISFTYTVPSIGTHNLRIIATDSNGLIATKYIDVIGIRNLYPNIPENGPAMRDVTYFKGAFYGAGLGGIIYQSLDGLNWNRIQTPSPSDLLYFHHNEIGICAIGREALIFSKDGVHWKIIPLEDPRRYPGSIQPSFFVIPTGREIAYLSKNGVEWYSMQTGKLLLGDPFYSNPNLPYEIVDTGELYQASPGKPSIPFTEYTGSINQNGRAAQGETIVLAQENEGVKVTNIGGGITDVTPSSLDPRDIAGGQSLGNAFFLLTGNQGSKRISYFSGDGETWLPIDGPRIKSNLTFKDGNFYGANHEFFWTSEDGIQWQSSSKGPYIEIDNRGEFELLSAPPGFLIAEFNEGDDFSTSFSKDGESWSPHKVPYYANIRNVIGEGDKLHAVSSYWTSYSRDLNRAWSIGSARIGSKATYGKGIFVNEIDGNTLAASNDGITWNEYDGQWIADKFLDHLIFDRESAFWYVSNNTNYLARSVDGINWEQKTLPSPIIDKNNLLQFKGKLYAEQFASEDTGVNWSTQFQNVSNIWLAATTNHLIAIFRNEQQKLEAHVNDGTNWTVIQLPQAPPVQPRGLFATNDTFFYVSDSWIYTSSDGQNWELGAQNISKQMEMTTADNSFFLFGDEASIREYSATDISIQSLELSEGEYGVGDSINLDIVIKNSGQTAVQLVNPTTVEILLSQRPNSWGADKNNRYYPSLLSLDPLSLGIGESTTTNRHISIGDDIKPGKYFVSAHIQSTPLLPDFNGTNDFYLGNRASIIVPERKLNLIQEGGGTITSQKALKDIPFKQSIQLIPKPAFGYEFSSWTGDIEASVEVADFVMSSDMEVGAIFQPRSFNVHISVIGEGTVLGAPDSGYSNYGASVQLQAEPNPDWEFLGWSGDRIASDKALSLQVGRDLQFTALFGQTLESWTKERFSVEELDDPEIWGPLADRDGNGFSNLQEYLFGITKYSSTIPQFLIYIDGLDICLLYPRSLIVTGSEHLKVWHSDNLSNWSSNGITERVLLVENGIEYVEASLEHPGNDPVFFEIRAISE